MKTLILVGLVAVGLSAVGLSAGVSQAAQPHGYHTPSNNYYQNNWMGG